MKKNSSLKVVAILQTKKVVPYISQSKRGAFYLFVSEGRGRGDAPPPVCMIRIHLEYGIV